MDYGHQGGEGTFGGGGGCDVSDWHEVTRDHAGGGCIPSSHPSDGLVANYGSLQANKII